jgi:osmoprotectant transport system ATP-binding protein
MFSLINVAKNYEAVTALQPTDLTLAAGCTTVLIGPSGCGKSTILRLMAGLILPDRGQILFGGETIDPRHMLEFRRRIGYVIQEGGLFPHITARQNVALVANYLKWSSERIEARVSELCSLAQLSENLLDRYPAQLSGGERQRVSLMRALMLDPEVLLLDEPLGALDPMIRFDLQQDLRHIFQQLRKTVVLVTHDLGEAGFLGDMLVLMRQGAIVQRGTLRELVQQPAEEFVERFVRAQRTAVEVMEHAK